MVQQPRPKLCKKGCHHAKFAINIIKYIEKSTIGSILSLTTLEGPQLNIRRSNVLHDFLSNQYFSNLRKCIEFINFLGMGASCRNVN